MGKGEKRTKAIATVRRKQSHRQAQSHRHCEVGEHSHHITASDTPLPQVTDLLLDSAESPFKHSLAHAASEEHLHVCPRWANQMHPAWIGLRITRMT